MTPGEAGPIWRGTDRYTRDQRRRRQLLDAALEVYGTNGFRAATVQVVCRQARVSTRSFYELYEERESLLEDLYDELNETMIDGIGSAVRRLIDDVGNSTPSRADAVAGFRGVAEAALLPLLEDHRMARVLEVEVVGVSAALEHRRRATYRRIAAEIDAGLESFARVGLIDAAPGGMTSLFVVGGITEALAQRLDLDSADRGSDDDFLDEVTTAVLRTAGL